MNEPTLDVLESIANYHKQLGPNSTIAEFIQHTRVPLPAYSLLYQQGISPNLTIHPEPTALHTPHFLTDLDELPSSYGST